MLTFQTILVPVDFSDPSAWAFQMARSLAADSRARLLVAHVVDQVHIAEQAVMLDESGMLAELPTTSPAYVESLEARLKELYQPSGTVQVDYRLREGDPAEETLALAKEADCDLIVMGSHGRTGLDRLLVGSVAEAVMRKAPCPVLIVKAPASRPSDAKPASTVAATIA